MSKVECCVSHQALRRWKSRRRQKEIKKKREKISSHEGEGERGRMWSQVYTHTRHRHTWGTGRLIAKAPVLSDKIGSGVGSGGARQSQPGVEHPLIPACASSTCYIDTQISSQGPLAVSVCRLRPAFSSLEPHRPISCRSSFFLPLSVFILFFVFIFIFFFVFTLVFVLVFGLPILLLREPSRRHERTIYNSSY